MIFLFSTPKGFGEEIKWVRVRLYEGLTKVKVLGEAIDLAKDLSPFKKVNSDYQNLEAVEIDSLEGTKRPYQLKVTQGHRSELFIESEMFLFGKNLKIGKKKIPPVIKISKQEKKLDLIAFVPLEVYLAGVIQGEVPKNWSRETLKAQIVAARTYALNLMENRKNEDFDLESSIKDQVFLYSTDARILSLAKETKNQVLIGKDKKIIKAYYHSECGGKTSSAKNVFGYSDDQTQVVDPFCQSSGHKPWLREVSFAELKQKVGDFTAIKTNVSNGERHFQITVLRDDEDKELISAQIFRAKLGYHFLKSTWFEIINTGKSLIFKGRGYGHGVGLCQWGAKVMGDRGYSYKEILKFYYPETKLTQI